MSEKNTHWSFGKSIKNLMIPYILSIVLTIFWAPFGTICMIIYWIMVLKLGMSCKDLASEYASIPLAKGWIFFVVAAIAGITTIAMNQVITMSVDVDAMTSILESTPDTAQALRLVAPYVIGPMLIGLSMMPAQVAVPAIFNLIAWRHVNEHVANLDDLHKRIVLDGIHKVLVAHKAQLVLGIALAGLFISIAGGFASIAASTGPIDIIVFLPLLLAGILAIFIVVVAIIAFFYLVSGYNSTGNTLGTIDASPGVEGVTVVHKPAQQRRCKECGNTLPADPGISFCPICGANLV